MCPPAPDIGFDCSDEEIFKSLGKMTRGQPLPGNVITDVNPYNNAPSNLSDSNWYLIHSKENANDGHGFWKIKGEAILFSDADINGCRTTFEFFEGQAPNAGKTDWLMYEYWITKKGLGKSSQVKKGGSLCRVFLANELDHDQRNEAGSHNSSNSLHQSKQSTGIEAHNSRSCCCTNEPEVGKDDDTGTFFLTGRPLDHHIEDLLEIDYVRTGDYLELGDFDDPISPSSSDNSSCLTKAPDECFDSPTSPRELKAEELPSREPLQKVDHCKFSVSDSVKTDKVVVVPPDSPAGLSVNAERNNPTSEEFIRTDSLLPGLTNCDSKNVDDKGKKQPSVSKEEVHHTDQGPSLNPYEVGPSSSRQNVSPSGGRRDARSRLKRLKKRENLCFMPFHVFL